MKRMTNPSNKGPMSTSNQVVPPKANKYFLVSKSKTIQINTDGDLIINDRKYEPKDDENKPKQYDAETEAINQTRSFYKDLLTPHVENLVVLSGAGTSVKIGTKGKVGKTMPELWQAIESQPGINLKEFCDSISFKEKGDLEKLLSKASRAKEFSEEPIEAKIKEIEHLIQDACDLTLPDNSPHEIFLNHVTQRTTKYPRVKLFTLNYDTLFEQAAEVAGFTVIDGFSFTSRRVFRGNLFDLDLVIREHSRIKNEENFAHKVFHLYKLHGSINWTRDGNRIVQASNTSQPLLIYPRDTKYEHAFEQPFFEMMSRFQQTLRKENVLLLSIGFSLTDKHILTSIKEAVSQNPSFQILIVNRTIRNDPQWHWFIEKARVDSRITLVAEEFKDFAPNYPEDETITKDELLRKTYNE